MANATPVPQNGKGGVVRGSSAGGATGGGSQASPVPFPSLSA